MVRDILDGHSRDRETTLSERLSAGLGWRSHRTGPGQDRLVGTFRRGSTTLGFTAHR